MAWPAVALNTLQTLNSLLDSNFVNHLEDNALTAIGSSTTTVFLFISISMAIGVAATAMVSRNFGAEDEEGYKEANRKCLGFAVLTGFILTILGFFFAPLIANFLVPSGNERAQFLANQYLGIFTFFLPAAFIIQTLAGSLRGIGDTKSPMIVSGAQIILHIILNFLLIFPTRDITIGTLTLTIPGANLELAGAAWSMVISGWIAAITYLFWCTKTPLGKVYKIKIPELTWIKRIFNLAAPAALMSLVRVTSLMAFTYILTFVPKSNEAIGALRPGFSIEAFAFMPAFGLAIAASALVGQSLGAKDPALAQRLGWTAAHQAAIISGFVAIGLFVFANPAANLLLSEQPEYAAITADYLRFIASTEILFAYGMVLISAQQGAGDTRRPFWLTLIAMWGIRVPLAAILALETITIGSISIPGFAMGANGCWLSLAATQAIQGLAAMWLWKKGDWKTATV